MHADNSLAGPLPFSVCLLAPQAGSLVYMRFSARHLALLPFLLSFFLSFSLSSSSVDGGGSYYYCYSNI